MDLTEFNKKDAKKLAKASVLSTSDDPKKQDRARARKVEVDYKDLLRQIKAKKKPKKAAVESFEIDKDAHNKAKKKAKLRNLARGNTNPAEKKAAERKAGGPKLIGEEDNFTQKDKELKRTKSARNQRYNTLHSGTNTSKNTDVNEGEIADKLRKVIADMKAADRKAGLLPGGKDVIDLDVERERRRKKKIKEGKTWDSWKKAAASALKRKKEEKKAQPATDAGARARRKLKDKEHNKYVNFLSAEDD